jgi:ribonuclease Z
MEIVIVEIYFLGTGAGRPSRERNVTSISLKLFEERGTFWLFDCGEGTQHQILNSTLKLSKLEKLFITHLHGDHLYGLPGILTTRSHEGATEPLAIYGPPGIRDFVESCLAVSQAHLDYNLNIEEIEEGIVFKDEQFIVEAALVEHRIESFGYRIVEQDKPGRLQIDKLQEKGISPGPVYAKIKKGIDVKLDNGEILTASDYVGPAYPGRIIVIMGDTRICDCSTRLSMDADVLVHEATFAGDLKKLAHQYFHTTAPDIARMAKECGVKALIITHISSRYPGKEAEALLDEARQIHSNSFLANDHWSFYVSRKT